MSLNKFLMTAAVVACVTGSVPAYAGVFDDGPNFSVAIQPALFGTRQIIITNVDKSPVTINSVEINNGGCKSIVQKFRTVKSAPGSLPKPEDFVQGYTDETRMVPNPNYHLGFNDDGTPRVGRFGAYANDDGTPRVRTKPSSMAEGMQPPQLAEHYKRGTGRWCARSYASTYQASCGGDSRMLSYPWVFDHAPTQADIEAHDPCRQVEDNKPFGNVTLIVGQNVAVPAQCPAGVEVVRVTVDTDRGTKTFEAQ
jgi:hypothetical protein